MKKLTSLMAMLLLAMLTVTFTSCDWDDDDYEAYTLEGAWRGNMGVVIWDGDVAYQSTSSEIYFDRDPYRYASGVGYQVDYLANSTPWYHERTRNYYLANHFNWEVVNGVIRIYYMEEDVYAEIRDYSLNYEYFRGWIDYEDGSSSEFQLRKTSSPNDYEHYYDWGYGYWDGYYYWSKQNTLGIDDGTRAAASTDKPMKPRRSAKKQ